ncbi:hypothetical protein TIFTF001_016850 [Ficus carica]|uniref:Retrotransposon gag domain-containing protein n=1 Tax=Ficus carica TaxID=3494 RepID=A0AA88A8I0_FICCA|nr:hypothetical protein TIFTF001_016850 [Ficus carica]
MMESKLPCVVPTCIRSGLVHGLSRKWTCRPNHSMVTRHVVLAERKLMSYIYAVVNVMDPRRVDEDRDAAWVFHGMSPLLFNGTCRTVSLVGWLNDMETIFRVCYIEAHLKVVLASRSLAGNARLWWLTLGLPNIQGVTWADFRALIIACYGPFS